MEFVLLFVQSVLAELTKELRQSSTSTSWCVPLDPSLQRIPDGAHYVIDRTGSSSLCTSSGGSII